MKSNSFLIKSLALFETISIIASLLGPSFAYAKAPITSNKTNTKSVQTKTPLPTRGFSIPKTLSQSDTVDTQVINDILKPQTPIKSVSGSASPAPTEPSPAPNPNPPNPPNPNPAAPPKPLPPNDTQIPPTTPPPSNFSPTTIAPPDIGVISDFQKPSVPKVDESSGALNFSIPIISPLGRAGLDPNLSLQYTNKVTHGSIIGSGWSFSIPSIERTPKMGVDQLYTSNTFTSSFGGELTATNPNTYFPRIEDGSMMRHTLNSQTGWTVTDKKGTTYRFGKTAQARQSDPQDTTHVARWMLEEIRDTNDNFIRYEYTAINGELYPTHIYYTGHGTSDGIFEVEFAREARADQVPRYDTGYLVKSTQRIHEITTKVNGQWARKYTLQYAAGNNGFNSLLQSITESTRAEDGTVATLPATTFDYEENTALGTNLWQDDPVYSATVPIFKSGYMRTPNDPTLMMTTSGDSMQFEDMNNDALPDIIDPNWNITPNTGRDFSSILPWSLPPNLPTQNSGSSFGPAIRLVDMNADYRPDLVYHARYSYYQGGSFGCAPIAGSLENQGVFLNTTTGWDSTPTQSQATVPVFADAYLNTPNNANTIPTSPPSLTASGFTMYPTGALVSDLNSDGIADFVTNLQWPNNMLPWPTLSRYTQVGYSFYPYTNFNNCPQTIKISDAGTRLLDVNADGLPDVLTGTDFTLGFNEANHYNLYNSISHFFSKTKLNIGNGFDSGLLFSSPPYIKRAPPLVGSGSAEYGMYDTFDKGVQFGDINGDGLVDAVEIRWQNSDGIFGNPGTFSLAAANVYLNTGTGWALSSIALPGNGISFVNPFGYDTGTRFLDYNGDGLVDFIRGEHFLWNQNSYSQYCGVNFNTPCPPYDRKNAYINQSKRVDILKKVNWPTGASTEMEYTPSPQERDVTGVRLNQDLPTILDLVTKIKTNDGMGTISETTYSYEGGKMFVSNPYDRGFAGFHSTERHDPNGSVTKTYYHQGDATETNLGEFSDDRMKIGKAFRTEVYDQNGTLLKSENTKWETSNLPSIGASRAFVYPTQTIASDYGVAGAHRDRATTYAYDTTNGNLQQKKDWGEVNASTPLAFTDIGNDDTNTTYAYTSSFAQTGTLTLPVLIETHGNSNSSSGNFFQKSQYFYDNLPFGEASAGNQTRDEYFIDANTVVATEKSHNAFGLVTQSRDPNNNLTLYNYDNYNLYPATVIDALNHSKSFLYNYALGKPKQVTDENGNISQVKHDGLGRTIEEKGSEPQTGALVTKATYVYSDVPQNLSVTKIVNFDANTTITEKTYLDSLGRTIQTRRQVEPIISSGATVSDVVVTNTSYDLSGRVSQTSLPYFGLGLAKSTTPPLPYLWINYQYDALDRVTQKSDAVGQSTVSFNIWDNTETDPDGKVKTYSTDAFGRLANVVERNNNQSFTTSYQYDPQGNLTKLTDALGNVRNFTYDNLGRRVTAEDLHSPTDTGDTFGIRTDSYDPAGNLIQSFDSRGVTTVYQYDALNRLTQEDDTSNPRVERYYYYDSCTEGIGKLCGKTSPISHDDFEYDFVGNIKTATKLLGTEITVTEQKFNRGNALIYIKHPDLDETTFEYNAGGMKERTFEKKPTDSAPIATVVNYDYAPTGAQTREARANGATISNTYDATHLYRMTQSSITHFSGLTNPTPIVAQSYAYTYSLAGDITAITESTLTPQLTNSITNKTYSYDDLHRLIHAETNPPVGATTLYGYLYNAIGNMIAKGLNNATTTYLFEGNLGTSYANPHAVTRIIPPSGPALNLSYDQNGNLLTDPITQTTNTFNYKNELIRTIKNNSITAYTYDSNGIRDMILKDTDIQYFPTPFYNMTIDSSGAKTIEKHIDGITFETKIANATANPVYRQFSIFNDHLSSTRLVTDTSFANNTEETVDYDPFGKIINDVANTDFREKRKYTSHEFDSDTGYTYAKARYLNTDTARFISEDPAFWNLSEGMLTDPQSLNSYAYARNNPIRFVDPDGKFWTEWVNIARGDQATIAALGQRVDQLATAHPFFNTALDHPYAPAVIGAAPLVGYGAVAAAPYVIEGATVAAKAIGTAGLVRGGLGAAANVTGQATSDALRGEVSSAGTYSVVAGTGFVGGVAGGPSVGIAYNALIGGGANFINQSYSNKLNLSKLDYVSLGISAFASGITSGLLNPVSDAGAVFEFAKSFAGFVFEVPLQVINTAVHIGIQKNNNKR